MHYLKKASFLLIIACLFFLFNSLSLDKAQSSDQPPSNPDPGQTWQQPETKIEFVWIPKGCYQRGSPPGEAGHEGDESPVHQVCLDGFWMGRTEVSRRQFNRFVSSTQYRTLAEKNGWAWIYEDQEWTRQDGYSWRTPGIQQGTEHPVIFISWSDARAMADWLSRQSGLNVRLPNEREWEYACRANTSTARYWGDDLKGACNHENIADLSAREYWPSWQVHPCSDGFTTTAPVGSFQANAFGLYDMLGNVQEWCQNKYDQNLYVKAKARSQPVQPQAGHRQYVIRGGSWLNPPQDVRCAERSKGRYDFRSFQLGFRLVIKPGS